MRFANRPRRVFEQFEQAVVKVGGYVSESATGCSFNQNLGRIAVGSIAQVGGVCRCLFSQESWTGFAVDKPYITFWLLLIVKLEILADQNAYPDARHIKGV